MSMIDFVRGMVVERGAEGVVLSVGGIGIRVLTAPSTANRLPDPGSEGTLYTYLLVREDALTLYGFATRDERGLFTRLLDVTGIGPKVAMGMLSASTADRLAGLIAAGDADGLARLPGIGKRTAQRIVLDLKGKIALPEGVLPGVAPSAHQGVQATVAEALAAFGYSPSEVATGIAALPRDEELSEADALRLALRALGSRS